MGSAFLILFAYNLLFFRKFYLNPYLNATGETLHTFYPVMRWQGNMMAVGLSPWKDNFYYLYPGCIPFLSNFYPYHVLMSIISAFTTLNFSFVIWQIGIYLHFFLASVLGYIMCTAFAPPEAALFGAISIAYMATAVRLQTPCGVYTACWIPGIFIGGWIGALSLAMAILGGYWPILVYFAPFIMLKLGLNLTMLGILGALPQIVPFLWYWPKSVHFGRKNDGSGKFPAWKIIDFFKGDTHGWKFSNVFSSELVCYCGLMVPLLAFLTPNHYILIFLVGLMLAMSWSPFRVPARAMHMACFFLVLSAVRSLSGVSQEFVLTILLIQGFSLLKNADIYPLHPFSEEPHKPADIIHLDLKRYPQFRRFWAYIFGCKDLVKPYQGGMALK